MCQRRIKVINCVETNVSLNENGVSYKDNNMCDSPSKRKGIKFEELLEY